MNAEHGLRAVLGVFWQAVPHLARDPLSRADLDSLLSIAGLAFGGPLVISPEPPGDPLRWPSLVAAGEVLLNRDLAGRDDDPPPPAVVAIAVRDAALFLREHPVRSVREARRGEARGDRRAAVRPRGYGSTITPLAARLLERAEKDHGEIALREELAEPIALAAALPLADLRRGTEVHLRAIRELFIENHVLDLDPGEVVARAEIVWRIVEEDR